MLPESLYSNTLKRLVVGVVSQSNILLDATLEAELQAKFGPNTKFLNTARGGSLVEQWQPGENFMASSILQTQALLPEYTLMAMVSWLGESDARGDSGTGAGGIFATLYWTALNHFRHRVGYPSLPILIAKLGRIPTTSPYPDWKFIWEAQDSIPGIAHGLNPDDKVGVVKMWDAAPYIPWQQGVQPGCHLTTYQTANARWVNQLSLLLSA